MSLTKHIEEKKEIVNYNANEIIYSHNWEKYRNEEYFNTSCYRNSVDCYVNRRRMGIDTLPDKNNTRIHFTDNHSSITSEKSKKDEIKSFTFPTKIKFKWQ